MILMTFVCKETKGRESFVNTVAFTSKYPLPKALECLRAYEVAKRAIGLPQVYSLIGYTEIPTLTERELDNGRLSLIEDLLEAMPKEFVCMELPVGQVFPIALDSVKVRMQTETFLNNWPVHAFERSVKVWSSNGPCRIFTIVDQIAIVNYVVELVDKLLAKGGET